MTLGLAATGKFPWRTAPVYIVSQLFGALLTALAVWACYGGAARSDAGLGATVPASTAGPAQGLNSSRS